MKRSIIYMALISILASSCSFLEVDESIGKAPDYMYGYFDELNRTVAHIYAQLPDDWGSVGGALREAATDNAIYQWEDCAIHDLYGEAWGPSNPVDDMWDHYYDAIRAVNIYYRDFDSSRFDRFEHTHDIGEQIKVASNYQYELHVLRAYFYFELFKRYRNIPLVKEACKPEEINGFKQASVDEIVSYMVSECDSGIVHLPATYDGFYLGSETGRVTKGAAMALKSRILLYAASPLFNEGIDVDEKYHQAALAAKELIDASQAGNWYAVDPQVQMWGTGNEMLASKQLILEKRAGNSNFFEKNNLPIGFEGGRTGNCPTQNLVDAYLMADGKNFDWDNPVLVGKIYQDRDPRLYESIFTNGSEWQGTTMETYDYGRHGYPAYGASRTGYYLKKYLDESVVLSPVNPLSKPHHYVLFRYSEILLNYAEALSEWKDPSYTDADFTISATEALSMVRSRVGMPAAAPLGKDEFRQLCRNERRVELAFEDHRFWDIRRWMIGPETTSIYGIRIARTEDGTLEYTRRLIQERLWNDRMYLYPISQKEMLSGAGWQQNPGWN